jgi:hypothetical protein
MPFRLRFSGFWRVANVRVAAGMQAIPSPLTQPTRDCHATPPPHGVLHLPVSTTGPSSIPSLFGVQWAPPCVCLPRVDAALAATRNPQPLTKPETTLLIEFLYATKKARCPPPPLPARPATGGGGTRAGEEGPGVGSGGSGGGGGGGIGGGEGTKGTKGAKGAAGAGDSSGSATKPPEGTAPGSVGPRKGTLYPCSSHTSFRPSRVHGLRRRELPT